MAHKIEIKELKREGQSVIISLSLIDDVTPPVTIESTQLSLTAPDGTDEETKAFIDSETLVFIQNWYKELKENIAKKEKSNAEGLALEIFINSNLTL